MKQLTIYQISASFNTDGARTINPEGAPTVTEELFTWPVHEAHRLERQLPDCAVFEVTCSESTTRTTFGTLLAASSALFRISGESTCPESVTTPFVEFTEIFVTLETPTSAASFDFTCAVICRSSTCPSGDSLVRHPRSSVHNRTKRMVLIRYLLRGETSNSISGVSHRPN